MFDPVAILERRVSEEPGDAKARYELAVLLLGSRDPYAFYPPDTAGVVARARELLTRAIAIESQHAAWHAALGFACHQLERLDEALGAFREARRLDPDNPIVDVYVPTMLDAMGREDDARAELTAVAGRRGVDLAALREQLTAANFPTDPYTLLMNGFMYSRNHLWSTISDEAEHIQNSLERERKGRVAQEPLASCKALQRELKAGFDLYRVPDVLLPLAAAASRLGVGDDVCRPLLMKRVRKAEREKIIEEADRLASEVHAWLDSFPSGGMSHEATAFMYLLAAVEEVRS